MLHMTDKVLIVGIETQNFFSGTETILQLPVQAHGSRGKGSSEHSAALASSWRGPAEPSAFRAARPAGPGISELTSVSGCLEIVYPPPIHP